jgi:hypothetical protein
MTAPYSRLYSFNPNISFQGKTLDELNALCNRINDSKFKLSQSIQYYLEKYKEFLDIPRLCRALAIPGEIASQFIEAGKSRVYIDGLDNVKRLSNGISEILSGYLYERDDIKHLVASSPSKKQKQAIHNDIYELSVYSKMYYDIENIKSDPLISDEYPYGNSIEHIIDIMNFGAIIIRFKYVSRNKSLHPEEKLVSYHIMDFNGKDVLGVHVQGDKTFSMYKQWGQGDERLIPIYPIYEDTIIRWGKE